MIGRLFGGGFKVVWRFLEGVLKVVSAGWMFKACFLWVSCLEVGGSRWTVGPMER